MTLELTPLCGDAAVLSSFNWRMILETHGSGMKITLPPYATIAPATHLNKIGAS